MHADHTAIWKRLDWPDHVWKYLACIVIGSHLLNAVCIVWLYSLPAISSHPSKSYRCPFHCKGKIRTAHTAASLSLTWDATCLLISSPSPSTILHLIRIEISKMFVTIKDLIIQMSFTDRILIPGVNSQKNHLFFYYCPTCWYMLYTMKLSRHSVSRWVLLSVFSLCLNNQIQKY